MLHLPPVRPGRLPRWGPVLGLRRPAIAAAAGGGRPVLARRYPQLAPLRRHQPSGRTVTARPACAHLDCDLDGPIPVVVDISRLMRSMTPPTEPAALMAWLARKADLFDRIATATADPGLATDARAVAAAARQTLADLVAPPAPSSFGGDAA